MPYSALINRANPSCFIFLLDQSGSMQDVIDPSNVIPLTQPQVVDGRTYTHVADGRTKSSVVADVINRFLMNLVLRCTREDGVRDYFDIGVIGYSGNGSSTKVASVFTGNLSDRDLVSISEIAKNPSRIEEKVKKVEDGAGGLVNQKTRFPIWLEPYAYGGTPMTKALKEAHNKLEIWVANHQASFPPIVINITDGEWSDEDPDNTASELTSLHTEDGNVLLFNVHITATGGEPVLYPSSENELTDQFAKRLFNISSTLPAQIVSAAKLQGYKATEVSKGLVYQADLVELIQFIDIGTSTSSNLR